MANETPNWVYGTKSSFSAGELTPTIEGRADLPLYQNGAKKIINWMILPSGGVTRRPGTVFIWAKAPVSETPAKTFSLFGTSGSDTSSGSEDNDRNLEDDEAMPMPTAQDLTSRLCRLRNKLEEHGLFFDYGILDREDAVYFDPQRDAPQGGALQRQEENQDMDNHGI